MVGLVRWTRYLTLVRSWHNPPPEPVPSSDSSHESSATERAGTWAGLWTAFSWQVSDPFWLLFSRQVKGTSLAAAHFIPFSGINKSSGLLWCLLTRAWNVLSIDWRKRGNRRKHQHLKWCARGLVPVALHVFNFNMLYLLLFPLSEKATFRQFAKWIERFVGF